MSVPRSFGRCCRLLLSCSSVSVSRTTRCPGQKESKRLGAPLTWLRLYQASSPTTTRATKRLWSGCLSSRSCHTGPMSPPRCSGLGFLHPNRPKVVTEGALLDHYAKSKKAQDQFSLAIAVNRRAIFCNNELNLHKIDAWGFDYDYTLATYTTNLNTFVYWKALQRLTESGQYPPELMDIPYDPKFVVRGLHYDIYQSVLFKLDAYLQIQFGTVYRGKKPLSDAEVEAMYHGDTLPWSYMQNGNGDRKLHHLTDLFSLPEAGILATVVDYFIEKSLDYDPVTLFKDVQAAVSDVHISGDLYKAVSSDLPKYLHKNEGLVDFLERLNERKKTMFLVTNSPYEFIDKGMSFMVGSSWRDLFDYIIVKAKKPAFFKDARIPFRQYLVKEKCLNWHRITSLKKGTVYAEGNIYDFAQQTDLAEQGVLYLGDHIYSDLQDPTLKLGWHTGAIVAELETEIKNHESRLYLHKVQWYQVLTTLIEFYQDEAGKTPETKKILTDWMNEKDICKNELKSLFNPQFGSMFRSFHNPSFFMRRLSRLADVYTSRLPNFLNYSLDHCFYPRRSPLPHENFFSVVPDKLGLIETDCDCRQGVFGEPLPDCKYRDICCFGGARVGNILY